VHSGKKKYEKKMIEWKRESIFSAIIIHPNYKIYFMLDGAGE
jgi:hypothetical protein